MLMKVDRMRERGEVQLFMRSLFRTWNWLGSFMWEFKSWERSKESVVSQ